MPGSPPKPFSLLIKPTSADCNLSCEYCFYLEKHALYPQTPRHRMADDVLEKLISSYLSTTQPAYYFGWQGGEPTLMGVPFFEKVIDFQKKYGDWGAVVSNGLQTNATLITDDLAALFAKYKFLLGVSLDGPPGIHDRYRRTKQGNGSHQAVMRGIERLKRHQVEFNVLVLVSAANIKDAEAIYHYLCDMGIYHHQYIPCVEFDPEGKPLPYTITGSQWGRFLCTIFDEWIEKDTHRVSIRHLDAVLLNMVHGEYNVCHMAGNCCQYFLVEHNGDVFPCDFFVEQQKKLGNVMDNTWDELSNAPAYMSFGKQKADWSSRCTNCGYLRYCSGDCLKNRDLDNHAPAHLSWLCEGWKSFYRHSLPHLEKLAVSIINDRQIGMYQPEGVKIKKLPKMTIKRNEPCYCGSGKKYKLCHGAGKRKE